MKGEPKLISMEDSSISYSRRDEPSREKVIEVSIGSCSMSLVMILKPPIDSGAIGFLQFVHSIVIVSVCPTNKSVYSKSTSAPLITVVKVVNADDVHVKSASPVGYSSTTELVSES